MNSSSEPKDLSNQTDGITKKQIDDRFADLADLYTCISMLTHYFNEEMLSKKILGEKGEEIKKYQEKLGLYRQEILRTLMDQLNELIKNLSNIKNSNLGLLITQEDATTFMRQLCSNIKNESLTADSNFTAIDDLLTALKGQLDACAKKTNHRDKKINAEIVRIIDIKSNLKITESLFAGDKIESNLIQVDFLLKNRTDDASKNLKHDIKNLRDAIKEIKEAYKTEVSTVEELLNAYDKLEELLGDEKKIDFKKFDAQKVILLDNIKKLANQIADSKPFRMHNSKREPLENFFRITSIAEIINTPSNKLSPFQQIYQRLTGINTLKEKIMAEKDPNEKTQLQIEMMKLLEIEFKGIKDKNANRINPTTSNTGNWLKKLYNTDLNEDQHNQLTAIKQEYFKIFYQIIENRNVTLETKHALVARLLKQDNLINYAVRFKIRTRTAEDLLWLLKIHPELKPHEPKENRPVSKIAENPQSSNEGIEQSDDDDEWRKKLHNDPNVLIHGDRWKTKMHRQ